MFATLVCSGSFPFPNGFHSIDYSLGRRRSNRSGNRCVSDNQVSNGVGRKGWVMSCKKEVVQGKASCQ